MMRSNNTSGQSLIWLVCLVGIAALAGCGDQLTAEEQETEEYRAALVSEELSGDPEIPAAHPAE